MIFSAFAAGRRPLSDLSRDAGGRAIPSRPWNRGLLCGLVLASLSASGVLAEAGIAPWMEDPFATPAPELMAAAVAIVPPTDVDAFILFDDVVHSFEADGRHIVRHRRIYRLLTPNGVDGWSTVGASWTPWFQDKPEIRARVIPPDGVERWLDLTTLTEAPLAETGGDIFDDRRLLQAPLPAVEVGSLVVQEIIVSDRRPFFAAGTYHRSFLVNSLPTHRARIRLQAPTSLPLRYGQRLADDVTLQRQVLEIEGQETARLVFTRSDMEAFEAPPSNLPYQQPRYPSVVFSTGDSWHAIATAYADIVDDKLANADLTEVLVGFPVGAERQRQIDFLLAQVQKKVRYTGLELGAASIIPVTPAELLERQFGDCKDQATLLVALLRQVGIEAHVALLRADFSEDIEPQLPGLGFFNHAIVYVPGPRPLWIDPTDPFARAGELPMADQGRWALVASNATRQLVPTPTSDSVDNRLLELREIFMADYGDAKVVETGTYHGSLERQQRSILRSADAETLQQAITTYVESEYVAEALESYDITPFDNLDQPLTIRLVVDGAQRASTDLAEGAVALTYGDLFAEIPEVLLAESEEGEAPRQDDFVFTHPFVKEWHYRIHLPVGMVPRHLPADRTSKMGGMVYEESFDHQPGLVTAELRLDSGLRRLSPEQFEATRQALREFSQSDITVLTFDHEGAAHMAAGRSREAVSAFRRLAREHPSTAVHRVRLANALLNVGMGLEARRQARLAVAAEPQSALAHWMLGFSLAHDEIGRAHHEGFDLEGASEALTKAHELDPSSPLFLAELAILQDFNAEGRRYGRGAALDRAADLYQRWRQEHGDNSAIVSNLLTTLYQAHRWQDLLDLTEELPDDTPDLESWRLTAIGALENSREVLHAAGKRDRQQRRTGVAGAAKNLAAAGHFATAGELLRQTASQTENPAATLRHAELLAAAKPVDELQLEADDPLTPVRRFFIEVLAPEPDVDALRHLFHPLTLEVEGEDDLAELSTAAHDALAAASGSMSVDHLLQLIFAIFDFTVHGDELTGYQVRIESLLPEFGFTISAYVRPWQGEQRIVSLGQSFAAMASQALDHLAGGNLPAARQWLDWARHLVQRSDSNDPLAGSLLARHWQKGQQADAETVRLVADLLLVQDRRTGEEPIARLRQRLQDTAEPWQQQAMHLALALRASEDEDWASFDTHSRLLLAAQPESSRALRLRFNALAASGQDDVLQRLAAERLAIDGEDSVTLGAMAALHLRRGEIERAGQRWAIIANGQGTAGSRASAFNSWAWSTLFQRPVDPDALRLAQKGAELRNYQSYAILHTLAMVYAELDRPLEAHRVLRQAMSVRGTPELQDDDLLVVGRIAQSYGLLEVARQTYARLQPGDGNPDPTSSWRLAQILLDELPSRGPAEQGP